MKKLAAAARVPIRKRALDVANDALGYRLPTRKASLDLALLGCQLEVHGVEL